MRRLAVLLALAAVVAAPLATATSLAPTVRIVSVAPLKVSGSHFKAHERLKVKALVKGTMLTRATRASAAGAFTVILTDAQSLNACAGGFTISVVTGTGSTISVKIPPRMCATRQP
jgi:hypothetical protein